LFVIKMRVLRKDLSCIPQGNEYTHLTLSEASRKEDTSLMAKKKNRAAVALGRKGGKARAAKLTDKQRADIARQGATATNAKRWGKG
jgi:hypothetical protein